MPHANFVHLRVHSAYSLSEGAIKADKIASLAYDAGMPMHNSMANRVSYVIAPDGKIIYEYTSLSPEKHVENTLKAVKDWAATHKQP